MLTLDGHFASTQFFKRRRLAASLVQPHIDGSEEILKRRLYLDVPFDQKERVKLLGGMWDCDKGVWYCPAGINTMKFKPWWRVSYYNMMTSRRRRRRLSAADPSSATSVSTAGVSNMSGNVVIVEGDGNHVDVTNGPVPRGALHRAWC